MRIVLVCSSNDGMCRSIITYGMAKVSAKECKTLVIDSNMGFRSLDLFDNPDNILYDLYDFQDRDLDMEDIFVEVEDNLFLLASSQSYTIDDLKVKKTGTRLRSTDFDFIFIDCPMDVKTIEFWGKIADEVVIITNSTTLSRRNTERINYILFQNKFRGRRNLILNGFNQEKIPDEYENLLSIIPKLKRDSDLNQYIKIAFDNLKSVNYVEVENVKTGGFFERLFKR